MSVTTPKPPDAPTPPPAQRSCRRCGTALAEDQDWCLNCGAAAGTRVESPRGWRVLSGVAIGGFVTVLGALAIAFLIATDDPPTQTAAVPTPAPAAAPPAPAPAPVAPDATPVPGATVAPDATPVPGATVAPDATPVPGATVAPGATPTPGATATPDTSGSGGSVGSWPSGKKAWTIVLFSATDRASADKKAADFTSAGTSAGVLHSDDFASLRRGYWVVYSGQYADAQEASAALEALGATAGDSGAYIRYVEPR